MLLTKEKGIRKARANRVRNLTCQPTATKGTEIKVHTPVGLLKETFPQDGFFQVSIYFLLTIIITR